MNNLRRSIILTFLFCVLFPMYGGDMNIVELIKKAEKDVVDLTVTWDLKRSSAFRTLEKQSSTSLDEALPLLAGSALSLQQKQILIFSLQKVDFDKYKYFLIDLATQYSNGKIEELIMEEAFIPEDWNFSVIENHRDMILRKALSICLKYKGISKPFKKSVNDILSGKALKQRNEFIKNYLEDYGKPYEEVIESRRKLEESYEENN